MNKMKAALIGFLPKEVDPYQTLEAYAKAGYRAFEGGDLLLKGDPVENRKRVEAFGMQPLAVHYNAFGETDVDAVIRNAHAVGVQRVACYAGAAAGYRFGGGNPPTRDDILREAEKFDKVAGALQKEGLVLSFHNHDIEFKLTIGGVPVIYLMAANTEIMKFEVDCGWVTYAGHDPIAFMKGLGDRLAAVHIKDFTHGEVPREDGNGHPPTMPRFTTPGTGLLDLKGCLETASEMGMEWAIVEQDFQYNLSELETLTAAYLNMKETGFVE